MAHPPEMIGRIGASTLENWAAQARITANESSHDDKGWDFILQLPSSEERQAGPFDRLPPELSCMVQVKTTLGDHTTEPIKLSNWRRMCSDPIPWFVLAVRIDEKSLQPVAAHLVHVDQVWCARVLMRLRELSASESTQLHEHTLNVSWSEDDVLAELHGRELARLVRKHVPDQRVHVSEKLRWFEDLGYEDRARHITVTVHGLDGDTLYSQLAELAVGIRTTFPKNWNALVSDVRFGIEATLREIDSSAGDIEYHAPPQGDSILTIGSTRGSRVVKVACKVYRACAVFPFLPENQDRIRLVGEDVRVLLSPSLSDETRLLKANIQFLIPASPCSLARLRKVVDIGHLIVQRAQDGLQLSLDSGSDRPLMAAGQGGPMESDLKMLVAGLDAAVSVCERFDIPPDTSVDPGLLGDQARLADVMLALMSEREGEVRGVYQETVPIGQMYCLIHSIGLLLLDRSLVLVFGTYGTVTESTLLPDYGAEVVARTGRITIRKCVISSQQTDEESEIELARESIRNEIELLGCRYFYSPQGP